MAEVRLRLWSHTCGFRGHFLTKSRRWSTTFGALREERLEWRLANRPDRRSDADSGDDAFDATTDEIEVREWNYESSGYLTTGDVCLARNLEDGLRLARWLSREEAADPGEGQASRHPSPVAPDGSDPL